MSTPATMKVASIMLGDARIYGDERLVAEVERLRREVEGQRGVIAALSDAAVKAAPVAPTDPAATATMVDAATLTDGDVMRIAEANRRAADTVYGCHVRGLATAYLVPQAGAKRA